MNNARAYNRGGVAPTWGLLGETVCGASHLRNGKLNQDGLAWSPRAGGEGYAVMAVADGHGGAAYFRSGCGARLAVESSAAVLDAFMDTHRNTGSLSVIKSMAEQKLPLFLNRSWQEAVAEHLYKKPVTAEELKKLEEINPEYLDQFAANPVSAYGATLLSVLVTPVYALLLQLGDGVIITVADDGEVRRPLPEDGRLFADETTSLGMREAWREFQVCFQALFTSYPALFMLSTDGYVNSFQSDEDFFQVGRDMLVMLKKRGLEEIREDLPLWLKEASREGSGDDATLGIVYREDIVTTHQGKLEVN